MAKPINCSNQEEALEIIELSIDSCDLLSRAFDLIVDLCENAEAKSYLAISEEQPLIH